MAVVDMVGSSGQRNWQPPQSAQAAPRSAWFRLTRVLSVLAACSGVAYGWVLAMPIVGHRIIDPWPMYWGFAAAGAGALLLRGWRHLPVYVVAVFVGCWNASHIFRASLPGMADTDNARASAIAASCVLCALVGLFLHSPGATRWMWLAITVASLPMGVSEAVTGVHHYTWTGDPHAPVAMFINTNNYATILVLTIGITLGWMTEQIGILSRLALVATAATCIWLTWMTGSRSSLIAVAIVLTSALVLALTRSSNARMWWSRLHHQRRHAGPRPPAARIVSAMFSLVMVVVVAAALLPFRNVVLAVLNPGDPSTIRSDNLRLELIRFALNQWSQHPWTGVGGGSLTTLWRLQDPDNPRPLTPTHNGFVQLLAEYGLLASIPLALLLAFLIFRAFPRRNATSAAQRPRGLDRAGLQHLLITHLVAFTLAGVLISNPIPWMPWWLMLATATICAIHLRRQAPAPGQSET